MSQAIDLKLVPGDDSVDLVLEDGGIVSEATLVTAVLLSLFTDGRADGVGEEIPDGTDDPRGWWGERRGERFGSKLWLLQRAKLTDETLGLVEEYSREALEWLVLEDIVERVDVEATRAEPRGTLDIAVTLVRGTAQAWATIWAATETAQFDIAGVRLRVLAA